MRTITSVLLIVFLGSFSDVSFAQQVEADRLFNLNAKDLRTDSIRPEIKVVSASRSEKFIRELPVTVYVIEGEEICRNGYSTLADVLRSIPGIKVSQPGSAIEGEMFVIRGLFGNYYTKILVDNIPVQPSVVSGMPIAAQLPVRQAERIEIIIGPASSVYGADAMTGVINIVTRSSERPVHAEAEITLGSPRYYSLNAFISGKAGKARNTIKYSFYGNATRQGDMNVKYDIAGLYNPSLYDSTYQFLQYPRYRGDSTHPEMNDLPQESNLLGIRLEYRGVNAGFDIMQRKTHSSIGHNTARYSYADPSAFWGETMNRAFVEYTHSWEKVISGTQLSYLRYRLDNQSSFTMTADQSLSGKAFKYAASDDLSLDQQVTWQPNQKLELTGGISFQYSGNLPKTNDLPEPFATEDYPSFSEKSIRQGILGDFGFNPLVFSNTGAFLQVFYKTGKLTALVSDRYDYHSLYGGSNNPRISFLYSINDNISVRVLYGQGLRVPSSCYTYNSLAFPQDSGFFYQIVPNPDLKPEKLHTAEIGYRYQPNARFSLDLVAYYQKMHDYISLSVMPLDPVEYPDAVNPLGLSTSYMNDEDSEFWLTGLQADLGLKKIVPSIDLSVDLSLSASKGKEILPNDLGTLDDVRSFPRFLAQLNIAFSPLNRIDLIINNTYSSKSAKRFFPLEPEVMEQFGLPVYVEGYYVLDIIARVDISRQLQAYVSLYNLTNSEYGGMDAYGYPSDLIYNPQYGRNFRFGLSFKLN
ncbi:MAG: TonB-dependent receptor [Bacteroidales bacterium]|nr:TonB-dependent receptor [Lentimicrobiaceae bacterium]MDD5695455.1 TonB-dependent receptor [Bacteroidales bacterium]